jgi:hypothetical protein
MICSAILSHYTDYEKDTRWDRSNRRPASSIFFLPSVMLLIQSVNSRAAALFPVYAFSEWVIDSFRPVYAESGLLQHMYRDIQYFHPDNI